MNTDGATARLTTAPARGGIAVIVLTGPGAASVLSSIFQPLHSMSAADSAGRLQLGRLVDDGEVLDEAIVAQAGSIIEVNIHGGLHVARRVLAALERRGADIAPAADADETFLHPRPLNNPAIAAEMLIALARATTPLVVRTLSSQWAGGLSALAAEAIPQLCREVAASELAEIAQRLRRAAAGVTLVERLLDPCEVVLAGAPNAGKSTLANALVGRQVSVVSPTPGTTRDWVGHLVDLDGVPARLIDTAGLWQGADAPADASDLSRHVDAEAVRRSWTRIERAAVVVVLTPGVADAGDTVLSELLRRPNVLRISSQCDRVEPDARAELAVSGKTLQGVDRLRDAIRHRLGFDGFDPSAAVAFTRRQADLLNRSAGLLEEGRREPATATLGELLRGLA